MLTKFKQNPTLNYFFAYSSTLLSFGIILGSLSPLINLLNSYYITQQYKQQQKLSTDQPYFYLNYCRPVGFIIGGILMNRFANNFVRHHVLIFGSIATCINLLLFTKAISSVHDGTFLMGLFITLASCTSAMVIIPTNMNLINIHVTNNEQFWLLIGHSILAFGNFIAPILVDFFKQYVMMFGGILLGLAGISYIWLPTPISPPFCSKVDYLMKNVNNYQEKKIQNKDFPKFIQYRLLFVIFLTIGMESTFSRLISFNQSFNYSLIFLTTVMLFRIITPILPGTPSQKIGLFIKIQIVLSIIGIIMCTIGYQSQAIRLLTIGLGAAMASHFSLHLIINFQFALNGYDPQQSGLVVISGTVAQLICVNIVKYLMQINFIYIFIFVFGISLTLNCQFSKLVKEFINQFYNGLQKGNQNICLQKNLFKKLQMNFQQERSTSDVF